MGKVVDIDKPKDASPSFYRCPTCAYVITRLAYDSVMVMPDCRCGTNWHDFIPVVDTKPNAK
jgi:hypothetical protein